MEDPREQQEANEHGHVSPRHDDYVLLSSVTHPGDLARSFEDVFKALVRDTSGLSRKCRMNYILARS